MTSQAAYVRTQPYPLSDLTPYPGNAKRGDVTAILESLCRNGQYRSVILRETEDALVVLAGNHTVAALAAHGPGPCGLVVRVGDEERPCALCHGEPWTPEARCEVVRCDDDTAARINLVDNRSAELGTWDSEALAELLGPMGDDLAGTGYNTGDLEDLLAALDEANDDDQDDDEDQEQGEQGDRDQPAPAAPPTPAGPNPDGTSTLPPGHAHYTLTFLTADRDEANRLVAQVRDTFPDLDAPAVVLRALRALAELTRRREHGDRDVPLYVLLGAAGIDSE